MQPGEKHRGKWQGSGLVRLHCTRSVKEQDALELKKEDRTLQSFYPLRAVKGFHTGKLQDQQKKINLKC